MLLTFDDIDVHVVILPELPSESDTILAPSGWAEEKVTSLEQV